MRGLKKKITALSLILLVLAAAFPMRALAETGAEYAAEITEEATETKAAEETFTQEEPGNTAGQEDAEHAAPVQESLGNEPGSSGTYAEECPVDTDIEIADREETASGTENAGSTGEYDTAADEPEDESVAEEGTFPGQENSVTEVSGSCDENGNGVAEEGVEKNERPEETEQESMPEDTGKEEGEDAGEQDGYEYGRDDDTAAQGDGGEEEGGEEGEDADELSQADGAAEGDAEEQAQEGEGKVYTFTVELLDVRDNVTVFRNGEKAAGIFGNNSPGEGSYFLAGAYRPEILREDPDGITRLGFGAEEGDVFRIEVQEPGYAVIGFACDGEAQYSGGQGRASYEVKISEDTTVRIDGDYSASAGYLSIGGNTRSLRSSPSAPSMPYSMYFWLGDSYDDYSSTAMINGHTGVYFFHPSGAPSGLYVSAVCGNTYRHMESGTHYRVARIAETAARSYLWYGDGCCSPRDQRALAWLIHHGQTEYDWRVANEGSGRMGDGKLYVSSQLEAYTTTFLAAWVLTNDGRTGDYGTVYASNGAASLDAMFGSAFSGGLPWSTRSAIDRMVSWALDFADRHTDPDAAIDEYRETYVYSDGYGDHQPLLVGAYRGHANGYLAVKKISTDPSITDGNGMYSFEGTEFTVTDANGGYCGTLTTDADGNTGSLYLTAGTYYVEETAAGNGYKRNTERKAVTVTAYETVTVTFENSPLFDPAGLHMRKWDSTSDSFVPQGIGSFSGARYRMDYYDNTSWQGTPEASWVLESDENGSIYYLPGYLIEGPDLYESGGAYVLPLGSVKLTEIQAPEGYLLSEHELKAVIRAEGDTARFVWTGETQGLIKAFDGGTGVPEIPVRGDISLLKLDVDGKPMAGIPFMIARLDREGNEVEKHVIVTDENGMIDTSSKARKHTNMTNFLDGFSDGAVYCGCGLDEDIIGVWFGEGDPDDSLGALIYGPYRIYELQCDATRDMQMNMLESGIEMIDADHTEISFGAMVDLSVELESDACDAETGYRMIPQADGVSVRDRVIYRNLTEGRLYTLETRFVLRSDLLTEIGSCSTDFVPEGGTYGTVTSSGTVTAETQVDAAMYPGETVVAFGRLYEYVDGKKVLIAWHEDPDDPRQTLRIPGIATKAKDRYTNDNVGTVSEETGITDTVRYTNLMKGEMFILKASVADPETGEILTGPDGEPLTAEKVFICGEEDGETVMPEIAVCSEQLEGRSAVVLEQLFHIENGVERQMALHAEMTDEGQTVAYPAIRTEAVGNATGEHTVPVSELTAITDTIYLKGLVPGMEYTLKGTLVYRDAFTDRESTAHEPGETIAYAKKTFTAEEKECWVTLDIDVDSMLLEGAAAVVFEELWHGGVLVASHSDIADEDQTVWFPSVRTKASDDVTGTQFVTRGEDILLTDKVALENLIPGCRYTVRGELVNRYTGESMGVVSESGEFTVEEPDITVDMTFRMDTEKSTCFTAVVFERLYLVSKEGEEIPLDAHEDLFDTDQTLYLPAIGTEAADWVSGTGEVQGTEETVIRDTVRYSDLMPDRRYTIEGILMDRETGSPVVINGETVTSSASFTADMADGEKDVLFIFDGRGLAGKTVVAFEKLMYGELVIASHEDPEDEDQSVRIIDIRTSARDSASGTKEASLDHGACIEDTVRYTGLTPGKTYTLKGKIVSGFTGSAVTEDGRPVSSEAEFIPDSPDGEVVMYFFLDTEMLQGEKLVVFERLYSGPLPDDAESDDVPVAVHEDINDADQTVTVPVRPPEIVDTGYEPRTGSAAAMMAASGLGLAWIMLRKRDRRR